MSYQTNNKYKVRISRGSSKAFVGRRRHIKVISVLATGFAGALIGGLLSAGVVISVYTNKVQTKPTLSTIAEQQSPNSINVVYDPSSYPVVDIAKNAGPAVVTICNFQSVVNQDSDLGDNDQSKGNNLIQMGNGSGFIIDADKGYIVTNNHVIKGAQKLLVCLANGNRVYADLVGSDSSTDLAVIKISNTKNLTAVELGDSSKLQVGEPVIVIGNPCGEELAGSVTTGIVSATNRILQGESSFNLIQTDAAINPGNSGGPLLNYHGQVIGINSAKYSQAGIEGIGFAIPITDAIPIIQQLIQKGYVSHILD